MTEKSLGNEAPRCYSPNGEVKQRSVKTEENAYYLADRLPQVLPMCGETYNRFLERVNYFLREILPDIPLSKEDQIPTGHIIKINENQLSKMLTSHNPWRYINDLDFRLIVLYLDYNGLFIGMHRGQEIAEKFPDPLFHSLLNFMGIGKFTLNNMKARAPGLYRAYRPASTFPGNFWVGALEIWINEESGAIKTTEFHQSGGFDGRPNKKVLFDGFLVRKGRHYTILSCNEGASSLDIAFLPSVMVEGGRITNMTGAVLDMSTGHLWGGQIIYDRIELDAETPYQEQRDRIFADARVCAPEDIPRSIAHHFKNDPIPNLRMF